MRLVFLNAGYGSGLTGKKSHYLTRFWRYLFPSNASWQGLNALLKEHTPDVVAFDEVDNGSFSRRKKSLTELTSLHGFHAVHRTKYRPRSFLNKIPMLKHQCNAVLTTTPTINHSFHDLKNGGHPLVIRTQLSNDLTLFTVHLALKKSVRAKQIKELGELIATTTGRIMVAGDFNTFAGFSEMQAFVEKHGLVSANQNNTPTFPAHKPKKELDYIFVCKNTQLLKFEVLNAKISDHLPLLVEVA